MSPLARVLLLTATALLTSGCRKIADTFFVATAETEQLCKTERAVSFPGAPAGQRTLEYTVEIPLGQFGEELPAGRLDTELWLRLLELDVPEGGVDLTQLQTVKVSLRREGATEFIRTLLEYSQPSQVFSPTRLTLRAVEAAKVPELGRDARVQLVLEARGTLPTQPWTANILTCVGVRAEVHYFQFIL